MSIEREGEIVKGKSPSKAKVSIQNSPLDMRHEYALSMIFLAIIYVTLFTSIWHATHESKVHEVSPW